MTIKDIMFYDGQIARHRKAFEALETVNRWLHMNRDIQDVESLRTRLEIEMEIAGEETARAYARMNKHISGVVL